MSDKKVVFVTRRIPEAGLRILQNGGCEVRVFPADRDPDEEELRAGLLDAEGLVCTLGAPVTAAALEGAVRLRVVATMATGVNNIDLAAARGRGIVVTNTPKVLTEATAEAALGMMLSVARRLSEGDRFVRAGRFKGWGPMQFHGTAVAGKTLGIVGAGQIGQAMGRMSRGLAMSVLYFNRSEKPEFEKEVGARRTDLDTLLKNSDFVSVHLPLTPETHHLLSREKLALMKPTAFLVNTARGPIVDEAALVELLQSGRLGGAALDVFEFEPKVPEPLLRMENVLLEPHLGSATSETRNAMAVTAAENAVRVLSGQPPLNPVA